MAGAVTVEAQGVKEIQKMFKDLPKQVKIDSVWGSFWRKNTKPLQKAAAAGAPKAKGDIPYPPDYKKWRESGPAPSAKYTGPMITKGTLAASIKFFRTRASKGDAHGAYIGPRVKGKFKKNKGGYFGAWVEYGHKLFHKGKMSEANPFMQKAFAAKSGAVLSSGLKDAEEIFVKAVKKHENRMQKYGSWGY